jgi:hypothetical protein
MAKAVTLEAWLAGLTPDAREAIDGLRAIIWSAGPGLDETIKWNAPSFADAGRDRVTLGLNPRGGYRMVLHRGAETQDVGGFTFDDPEGLAAWPARDRGVVTVGSRDEVDRKATALENLVRRWLAATADS